MKNLLITTLHRGVFFGQMEDDADLTAKTLVDIKNARMCIYWRNGNGVMGLAKDGPDLQCKIAAPADIEVLHDITAVFVVTDEAAEKWMSA